MNVLKWLLWLTLGASIISTYITYAMGFDVTIETNGLPRVFGLYVCCWIYGVCIEKAVKTL